MTSIRSTACASAALAAAFVQTPAHADWVTLPNTGGPITACNPKVGNEPNQTQSSTLTTCKVTGLPPAIMAGYILKDSADGSSVTINSTVVGQRYDRVYCKAVSGTSNCDFSAPVVIATRLQMSSTASARNSHCPVWSGTTSDCFEVNKVFRLIRGSNPVYNSSGAVTTPSVEVSTDIAYFMGSSSTSTSPDTALATKYLEFAGKSSTNTLRGTQASDPKAPGNANYVNKPTGAGDRDATRVMFQADVNAFDPDGGSSKWSPWLMQRQACPNGYNPPTTGTFSIRLYEAGEEGQLQQAIQSTGYSCKP